MGPVPEVRHFLLVLYVVDGDAASADAASDPKELKDINFSVKYCSDDNDRYYKNRPSCRPGVPAVRPPWCSSRLGLGVRLS